ncbi:aminopeptidase N [Candidatus Colwellia aromaticivorans]|uniref:aminopeptidase N n=1 Tax=Candidatus Colwellia aromaticivorans TaxID=2267621 RepID=UPI000DF3B0CD|nr:aminopeptidase N [Candidatus Colwellia aromaticivorans]
MTRSTARFLADYSPANFTIETVNLTIELDDTNTQVINELIINRRGEHKENLILDGEKLTLVSVSIDNELLSTDQYQQLENSLIITTDKQNFKLIIITEINPVDNTSLEGLFKSGGAFCSQCESEGFRRISYYLDRPDVMAIFTTTVIGDKTLYPSLLSNGNKIDHGELADNKHFSTWYDPFPKPCYLFALVAGDFDLLADTFTTCSGKEVALEIFVDKGNLHKAEHAMVSLKKSMTWDEQTFGLEYDLNIYMIVAVDFFNMGAMENKGLNVFNSKYVLADKLSATDTDYFNIEAVIAHEYFHNWTGNRVTCRDWFQLSLKEGLTVFRDQQFSADMHSSSVTRIQNVRVLRSLQFAEDAGPMAHPIRPEKVLEMNNFYTLTVYEKGAEVIRMLHTLLGKDNFRSGMDLYFKRFDGMAVTCDDFIDAMSDASNKDLRQFKLWYSQSGTPAVRVSESFDAVKNEYHITLAQQSPITTKQPSPNALHIPIKLELIVNNDNEDTSIQEHLIELKAQEQSWTFSGLRAKPTLALLADFSAPVKVNFVQDDESLFTIISNANNSFCRWDAGQKLLMSTIKELTLNPSFEIPEQLIICFTGILSANDDPAFIAEQLALPSFDEAADLIEQVDPISLVNAINTLTLCLAQGLEQALLSKFKACSLALELTNICDADIISNKALKNTCLFYLAAIEQHAILVDQQFESSDNMTDSLAALNFSARYNLVKLPLYMQKFEQQWQTTSLVMDKWFSLGASVRSDDIFEQLNKLIKHELFSLKNPNRARSLIGAFAMNNPKYFHSPTGEGYQFLADNIAELNTINPQVASRLISPLIQFNSFAQPHKQLMQTQLVRLQALPNLSNDLKEKLDAALAS